MISPVWRSQVRLLAALVVTAVFAGPLYLALVNVFKPAASIRAHPLALPTDFTTSNVVSAAHLSLVQSGLKTSLIITTCTVLLMVPIAAMVAYYISRWDTPVAKALLLFFLLGLMLPPQVVLIPTTVILRKLHLQFTYWGVILNFAAYFMPFGVFVFSGFLRSISRELDEAGAIDGASSFKVFWRIIFPLMRPATASVVIVTALWTWNDFLTPLIILGAASGVTITTGIYLAIGTFSVDYGQEFGVMFLASLPILAFFLLLQRHFVSGLTGGATKG
ncbi:MAG: carbohydrate ABC transporter permease [Gaiellaceae bacterium]